MTGYADQRRHLRFKPDPLEYAQVAMDPDAPTFTPSFVALIIDESPISGCSLIAHEFPGIEPGRDCTVKIGDLDPLLARVTWKTPMDSGIMRIGLEFLE